MMTAMFTSCCMSWAKLTVPAEQQLEPPADLGDEQGGALPLALDAALGTEGLEGLQADQALDQRGVALGAGPVGGLGEFVHLVLGHQGDDEHGQHPDQRGQAAATGEIQAITSRKSSTKGRSIRVVTVAEAMKSRTPSKARRLAAKEPTEAGRASMRRPSTRSMMRAESCTSMRLPALSTM